MKRLLESLGEVLTLASRLAIHWEIRLEIRSMIDLAFHLGDYLTFLSAFQPRSFDLRRLMLTPRPGALYDAQ